MPFGDEHDEDMGFPGEMSASSREIFKGRVVKIVDGKAVALSPGEYSQCSASSGHIQIPPPGLVGK